MYNAQHERPPLNDLRSIREIPSLYGIFKSVDEQGSASRLPGQNQFFPQYLDDKGSFHQRVSGKREKARPQDPLVPSLKYVHRMCILKYMRTTYLLSGGAK